MKTMTRIITPEDLKEAFSLFDKDSDGCITSAELLTVMRSLGQPATAAETKQMIQRVDTDGNGLIDFDEFMDMMCKRDTGPMKRSQDAEMRALFAAFDKDGSGYIDKPELKVTMKEVGLDLNDRDIETMMKVAGVAIKDRIFYEDFVKMMTGQIGLGQNSVPAVDAESSIDVQTLGYQKDDDDIQELRVAFSMFDKDGDGQITTAEVTDTMRSLGMKVDTKEVRKMIRRVDTDGDGTISFDEFTELMRKYKMADNEVSDPDDLNPEANLSETFQIFDKDQDGFLNAYDLRSTMQQLGLSLTQDDIHAMMRSVGVGPNGRISYPDFCKIFSFTGKSPQPESKILSRTRASDSFSSKEKKELQAVFSVFDKDRDGFITMDEVIQVLESMGVGNPSREYISDVFKQVDLDGNGTIDFKEFMLLVHNYERPMSEEQEIREMFNTIDKDRSGFIDVDELKATFTQLGVPLSNNDVRDMMKEANVTGTRIFFEDFVQIMMGNIGAAQKKSMLASRSSIDVRFSSQQHLQSSSAPPPLPPAAAATSRHEETFSESELKELHIQFAQFDKDADGVITTNELAQVMHSIGIQLKSNEIKRIVDKIDVESHGRVDFKRFCQVMKQYNMSAQAQLDADRLKQEETQRAFAAFDKNKDGYIDEQELRETMRELGLRLSVDDIQAMMKQAGCKITGRIYYEEFVKVMVGEVLKSDSKRQSGITSKSADASTSDSSLQALQDLNVSFAMIDKNHDGRITPRELMSVMTRLGFKTDDAAVKKMIQKFDVDGNGTLEFNEFSDMMRSHTEGGVTRLDLTKRTPTPPDTWKAFKVFDRDSDGYISMTELKQTMEELGLKLSADDLDEMMNEADINKDGKVDYAEFSKLMSGSFESFAKQAAQLHEQKSMYEAVVKGDLTHAGLKEAFDEFDKNSDGQINAEELESVARNIGHTITLTQAEAMIKRCGTPNGTVGFNEFLTMISRSLSKRADSSSNRGESGNNRSEVTGETTNSTSEGGSSRRGGRKTEEEDMRTAFKVFDQDGNGFIDASELKSTMQILGQDLSEKDVSKMMRLADKNGDGQIDYEEFIHMMYSK